MEPRISDETQFTRNTCVVSTGTIAQALEQENSPSGTIHYTFHHLHPVICRFFFKERGERHEKITRKRRKRKMEKQSTSRERPNAIMRLFLLARGE